MGIAEADMTSTAAGLAAGGKIPFTNSFAVFSAGRAFDQIRQTIAIGKLNVKSAVRRLACPILVMEQRTKLWRISPLCVRFQT